MLQSVSSSYIETLIICAVLREITRLIDKYSPVVLFWSKRETVASSSASLIISSIFILRRVSPVIPMAIASNIADFPEPFEPCESLSILLPKISVVCFCNNV